jgi:hypothetical protein
MIKQVINDEHLNVKADQFGSLFNIYLAFSSDVYRLS